MALHVQCNRRAIVEVRHIHPPFPDYVTQHHPFLPRESLIHMANATKGTHPGCREGRILQSLMMAALLPAASLHPQPLRCSDRRRVETMLDEPSGVVQPPRHGSVSK